MSQPLTLTLARKAPRTTQIAGSLLVACLLILPFLPVARDASAGAVDLDADADRQNPLLRHRCRGARSGVGLRRDALAGHGIFFALGGYAMGMYLMRQAAGDGLPAFMSFLSWSELPWFWWGTQHFAWALVLIVQFRACWRWCLAGLPFAQKSKGSISRL
jgi:urea transport system permease protein